MEAQLLYFVNKNVNANKPTQRFFCFRTSEIRQSLLKFKILLGLIFFNDLAIFNGI